MWIDLRNVNWITLVGRPLPANSGVHVLPIALLREEPPLVATWLDFFASLPWLYRPNQNLSGITSAPTRQNISPHVTVRLVSYRLSLIYW